MSDRPINWSPTGKWPGRLCVAAATAACVLMLTQTGCYRRVVSASGPGSENYQIHESNQDDIVFGRWFGEGPKSDEKKQPNYKKP